MFCTSQITWLAAIKPAGFEDIVLFGLIDNRC